MFVSPRDVCRVLQTIIIGCWFLGKLNISKMLINGCSIINIYFADKSTSHRVSAVASPEYRIVTKSVSVTHTHTQIKLMFVLFPFMLWKFLEFYLVVSARVPETFHYSLSSSLRVFCYVERFEEAVRSNKYVSASSVFVFISSWQYI